MCEDIRAGLGFEGSLQCDELDYPACIYSWTADQLQDPPATLAAVSDKKKPSKKKAKVVQDHTRDVENASPLLDAQTGGLQPDVSFGIFIQFFILCVCYTAAVN